MKRRDGNLEMDTRGSPDRLPSPTDGPLRREGDTVVAALSESLFRRIPSPEEEQRGLWERLESLHPQNSMMLVDILQQVHLDSAINLASGL